MGDWDDDDGGDGPALPFEPRGGEGECRAKWTREPELTGETIAGSKLPRTQRGEFARIQTVTPDAALQVTTTTGGVFNWVLIPYVHLPSLKQMRAFDQALTDEFGVLFDKKEIVARAKEADVRKKLRECYDALWVDHNLISMSLYSGPLTLEYAEFSLSLFRRHVDWSNELGGWMLTGDAHLNVMRRRKRFLQFYRRVTPLINVFMLPHHGSIYNHSDIILDAMPNLMIAYAASGPNNYGHPHQGVKDAVDDHGRAHFHRVSEKRRSRIVLTQSC